MTSEVFDFDPKLTEEFIRTGELPYRDDPNWIAPFVSGVRARLRSDHEFFRYGTMRHVIVRDATATCGRVSAILNPTTAAGGSVGFLGFFECVDDPAVASRLISIGLELLRDRGVTTVHAPVDGSTWYRYRLLTEGLENPPFLLEPQNPSRYPHFFESSGFSPFEFYNSAVTTEIDSFIAASDRQVAQFHESGYRLRPVNLRTGNDMRLLHSLFHAAFATSLDFSSITVREFTDSVAGPLKALPRDHVMFALNPSGFPIGVVVCVPDYTEAVRRMRGKMGLRERSWFRLNRGHPRTLIIKTLAVEPRLQKVGAGRALVAIAYRLAKRRGYTRVIHALMVRGNPSQRINRENMDQRYRGYTLYATDIG